MESAKKTAVVSQHQSARFNTGCLRYYSQVPPERCLSSATFTFRIAEIVGGDAQLPLCIGIFFFC